MSVTDTAPHRSETVRLPLSVAVANDYEVVVRGVAAMLARDDRVQVTELVTARQARASVDVVLFDAFGRGPEALRQAVDDPTSSRVVVFSWTFDADAVDAALRLGASGYIGKGLRTDQLVDALVRIHGGEVVVTEPSGNRQRPAGADWPGRRHGLTEREAEVLALITQGLSNQEIADRLYLSINSIKTHIRKLYAKIDVRDRSQALLWGIDHGFRPDEG